MQRLQGPGVSATTSRREHGRISSAYSPQSHETRKGPNSDFRLSSQDPHPGGTPGEWATITTIRVRFLQLDEQVRLLHQSRSEQRP
jgi:hypothetical protein